MHNRGLIADPEAFAREAKAASWLFLCGEEFSAMEGGMAYASVQAAVGESVNIVSDPPRVLDMDLARQLVATGATSDEVLARAAADGAPFAGSDELKSWVAQGLAELS